MRKFTIVKFLEEYRKISKQINKYNEKVKYWQTVQESLRNSIRATLNIDLNEVKVKK